MVRLWRKGFTSYFSYEVFIITMRVEYLVNKYYALVLPVNKLGVLNIEVRRLFKNDVLIILRRRSVPPRH